MKDFITKIDDDATDAGVVVADEYNSIFTEAKNAVKTFLGLNDTDDKQLQKAIDIASKAMFYTDAGTANSVQLIRGATTETTETLFDGMVVYFLPSNANTGATTLKVTTLTAKPLFYNGADLPAGYLNTISKYVAVYDATNDRFNVDVIAGGSAKQPYKVDDATSDDEAINRSQLNASIAKVFSIDNFMHIIDQKASGTHGGAIDANYKTRDLNTVLHNSIVGASLSANEITLPAGTYFIEATAPSYRTTGESIAQIIDTTATDVVALEGQQRYDSDTVLNTNADVSGVLTFAEVSTITLRQWFYDASGWLGYAGANMNDAYPSIYSDIKIWKVS